MNASKPGLGAVGSTRPLSRAERRAQAAQVQADPDINENPTAENTATTTEPEKTITTPIAPPATIQLPKKAEAKKQQFGTQLYGATIARLDYIKRHGHAITDVTDSAINDYLDRAGVPRPDNNGNMPD